MRDFVRAFVVLPSIVFPLSAKSLANPGHTTRVQAQNKVPPNRYNDLDTPCKFSRWFRFLSQGHYAVHDRT